MYYLGKLNIYPDLNNFVIFSIFNYQRHKDTISNLLMCPPFYGKCLTRKITNLCTDGLSPDIKPLIIPRYIYFLATFVVSGINI